MAAQYKKIASLSHLNEKKKGEGGKEWRVFQRVLRRKQLFLLSCFFKLCLFLSGQQQNVQIDENKL